MEQRHLVRDSMCGPLQLTRKPHNLSATQRTGHCGDSVPDCQQNAVTYVQKF